jgi:hypothetical protein
MLIPGPHGGEFQQNEIVTADQLTSLSLPADFPTGSLIEVSPVKVGVILSMNYFSTDRYNDDPYMPTTMVRTDGLCHVCGSDAKMRGNCQHNAPNVRTMRGMPDACYYLCDQCKTHCQEQHLLLNHMAALACKCIYDVDSAYTGKKILIHRSSGLIQLAEIVGLHPLDNGHLGFCVLVAKLNIKKVISHFDVFRLNPLLPVITITIPCIASIHASEIKEWALHVSGKGSGSSSSK